MTLPPIKTLGSVVDMKKLIVFIPALFIFFISAKSYALSQKDMIGSWELLTYEKQDDKGNWKPRCSSPDGMITYTRESTMAVGINCMKAGSSSERSDDPDEMVFYSGQYSTKENKVIHHVLNSSKLDWIGKDLEREVSRNGNKITLTGKGKAGIVRLSWQKIKN
ncbi:MAG: hypothetical protein JWQ35_751 [Bacteriovoracaceae bacterium]|nr:hypothetical protein [Bacteriovoracaceae bacterium]